jgi:hypothetical protein
VTVATGSMRASIEVDELHLVRGYGIGTPLTQALVDTTKNLLNNGGTGYATKLPDRFARRYNFEGPPEFVRPVINAFMEFLNAQPTNQGKGN